jgi:hypothetical protein
MERYCSTGQSPQLAVVPVEEEEEGEEEEGEGGGGGEEEEEEEEEEAAALQSYELHRSSVFDVCPAVKCLLAQEITYCHSK